MTPEETYRIRALSNFMIQIQQIIHESRWSAAEATKRFHTTRMHTNQMLADRTDLFQIKELLAMVATLGRKVRVEIEAA